MKFQWVKKTVALLAAGTMALGLLAGCGGSTGSDSSSNSGSASSDATASTDSTSGSDAAATTSSGENGKILYLSNISSGAYYDYYVAFYQQACADLGYKFEVVYGDSFNDPDGNLTAVRNAYTSDVVGLITCQDGGIGAIMEEYPELWVASNNSDMDSVFEEDGASHEVMSNDHYLGAMGDGYISGVDMGKQYAQQVIDAGFKKVATIIFPVYAYPKHTVGDAAFREAIAEYNETADEPIEIVGDATVLQFQPLGDDFFMEADHQDLDAVVGMCAGTTFIYPTMLNAKAAGTCAAKTVLLTNGYDNNEELMADCGDDEGMTVRSITIACPEGALFPLALIDNAVQGKQYADFPGAERHSSGALVMDTTEKFQAIKNDSPLWAADVSKLSVSWEEMKQYFTRYNENATYADLVDMCGSITIDNYLNK